MPEPPEPELADLHPDDPRVLGPYRLTGRLHEHPAGAVLAAEDVAGRSAVVAVLNASAASDAAVRDRLVAATAILRESATAPVHDGLPDPVAWVALTAGDTAPADALGLLDAAALTDGPSAGQESVIAAESTGPVRTAGPDFAPHWTEPSGSGPSGNAATDTEALSGHDRIVGQQQRRQHHRPNRGLLAAIFVVLGLAVIGLIVAISMLLGRLADGSQEDPVAVDTPRESDESLAPDEYDPPDDSGAPDWWPEFDDYDGPDGPAGPVAGPTYGADEPLREQTRPFTFDLPRAYGCLSDGDDDPPAGSILCIDESQTFDRDGTPPGGRVRLDVCAAPCDTDAWERTRAEQAGSELPWEPVDDATLYLERPGTSDDGEETVLVAMSRLVQAPDDDTELVLFATFTGRAGDLPTFHKIVNELHTRTEAP